MGTPQRRGVGVGDQLPRTEAVAEVEPVLDLGRIPLVVDHAEATTGPAGPRMTQAVGRSTGVVRRQAQAGHEHAAQEGLDVTVVPPPRIFEHGGPAAGQFRELPAELERPQGVEVGHVGLPPEPQATRANDLAGPVDRLGRRADLPAK